VVVSELLADATTAAFAARFDQQALLNGCRLLAVLITSMRHNDLLTATLYNSRILLAANRIGHHSPDQSHAHRRRGDGVLRALVAETAAVWRAAGTNDELYRCAQDAVTRIVSATPRFDDLLAVLAWHARLTAAGWPVDRQHSGYASNETAIRQLPAIVVAEARDTLLDHLGRPLLPVTLLTILWTNAAVARSEPVTEELREIVNTVRKIRARIRDYGVDDDIERFCESIRFWLDNNADNDSAAPRIQSAGTPPSLRTLLRKVKPHQRERTYHGVHVDGNKGVLVTESDRSTRLLRYHHDLHAVGVFGWDYGGTGPHQLAMALAEDCVGELLRCPTCLGSTQVALGMIECPDCSNTGRCHPLADIASGLDDTVTSKLPHVPGCAPTRPGAEWSLSHDVLVEHVIRAVIVE
jgi:hypothetical protein